MADEAKEKKKVKKPTALKRIQQNEVKYKRNRMWKKRILTARVKLSKTEELAEKEKALSSFYKVVDKAVKKGVMKKNTAARVKSRLSTK